LTVKDVAEHLQVKPATVYAWATQQKIPFLKIHGVIRFDREAIDEWLKTFEATSQPVKLGRDRRETRHSVEALIARAKRAVYTRACEKPDEDRAKQGG
jgi:excisionase family DNA binding protein